MNDQVNAPLSVVFVGPRYGSVDWKQTILSRNRFKCFSLPDLDAVIAHCAQRTFDLVILGVTAEGIAAAEKISQLRARTRERTPKVILSINDLADRTLVEPLMGKGFSEILAHPFDAAKVNEAVGRALGVLVRDTLRVVFRVTLEGTASNQSVLATTIDISEAGALVLCGKRMPINTAIHLKVMGAPAINNLECNATVVREDKSAAKPGQFAYGLTLKFNDLAVQERWFAFIRSLV